MTLEEAIKHCEDVADYDCFTDDQRKCSDEHRQLADWLRELKKRREKEVTGDLISRQTALSAIEANQGTLNKRRVMKILEGLPSAEKAQLSEEDATFDCISRQDAIDAIMSEPPDAHYPSWYVDILWKFPSVQTRKGKWIYGEKSGQDGWYCSECGGFIPWYYDFYGLDNIDFIEDFKTCPFCDSKMVSYTGADMREGEQSE